MSVGKTQSVTSAYGTQVGRIGGRSSSSQISSAKQVQQVSSTPAVINQVDEQVYSAVNDFLNGSGDEKLDSYSDLPSAGKRKFMKIVGKLVSGGEVDSSQLDLGESTPAKESFLQDYSSFSDNTIFPYSSDGKIAG